MKCGKAKFGFLRIFLKVNFLESSSSDFKLNCTVALTNHVKAWNEPLYYFWASKEFQNLPTM
jgi:hypothetical protein